MEKKMIKYLLTVICMLAAGICYIMSTSAGRASVPSGADMEIDGYISVGGEANQVDLDGQTLTMDLRSGQTRTGTDGQSGLISAETEAGEMSEGSGIQAPQELLPRQTESVRFYVHICGEVKNPGVYEVEPQSRIFQVVELAGGLTEEAAGDYLNMAQETADGMKITVPSKHDVMAEVGAADGESIGKASGKGSPEGQENLENPWVETAQAVVREPAVGPGSSVSSQKINLNTADKEALMTLKGIGEAKAEAIIRYREEQGPFRTIEEIMNISGIKEAAFEKIKDDITV